MVIKCFKHINDVSNSNLVRIAEGLLSRKGVEVPVISIGESKVRAPPPQKFKVFILNFLEIFIDLPNEVWLIIVKNKKLIGIFNFSINFIVPQEATSFLLTV